MAEAPVSQRLQHYDSFWNAFWMPFTSNKLFKSSPRLISKASGIYYYSEHGHKILDGTCGLWCCNLGHGRPEIINAVSKQLQTLDYAPSFQVGHELPFALANRLLSYLPENFTQAFFVNSGSEATETALKMALAYHQLNGNTGKKRLIGRELGYHGAGFAAISVGGIENNRRLFPNLLQYTDHLPSLRTEQTDESHFFTRGEPDTDNTKADALLDIIARHGADTIAAVIVEPVCCSGGVLIPPKGHLKRLREICTRHDILLIADEVITALGRLGCPFSSTDYFDAVPDIIITAKSLANGVIPIGAVFSDQKIYDCFMTNSDTLVEFFHGYTFGANPAACSATMACLDICESENLFHRAKDIEGYWEDAVHSLRGLPHIKDIRNMGLLAGIELLSEPGEPVGKRTWNLFRACFEKGLLTRANGETLALCPPLIIEKKHIDLLIAIITDELKRLH